MGASVGKLRICGANMIWEADAVVSDLLEVFRMREAYMAEQLDRTEIMHFGGAICRRRTGV
jgi:hypothetical protein